jgi:hypothetical protein
MHPRTSDIQEFASKPLADAANYTVALTKEQATALAPMNRKQRRAWLSRQRKAQRAARRPQED